MKLLKEKILEIWLVKARNARKVYIFLQHQIDIAIGADIGKEYKKDKINIKQYLVTARYDKPYHRSIWYRDCICNSAVFLFPNCWL